MVTRSDPQAHVQILPRGCICGHDHLTDRGESIDLCLECSCDGWTMRCQNCGGEVRQPPPDSFRWQACSQRCVAQLDYAKSLTARAAA